MSETDDFLNTTMARLHDVETALHDGDPAPRKAMWSHADPVTLFGAALGATGWAAIEPLFDRLGSTFSTCTSFRNEVVAAGASGDLAYTVAFEHTTASLNGGRPLPYTLRVTTVFRREGGEWKVVHRHADPVPSDTTRELMDQLVAGKS
jgi:ketosteroid isomerase-like protein